MMATTTSTMTKTTTYKLNLLPPLSSSSLFIHLSLARRFAKPLSHTNIFTTAFFFLSRSLYILRIFLFYGCCQCHSVDRFSRMASFVDCTFLFASTATPYDQLYHHRHHSRKVSLVHGNAGDMVIFYIRIIGKQIFFLLCF